MELVQPIRDEKKIKAMVKVLLSNKRDLLLFILGINSGLRISDILNMKVSDVIDEKGKPKQYYELKEEKTGKYKRFPFGERIQKAIMDYLKDYNGDRDRPLFASRKGNKAISRQQAWQILNDAAKAVGIEDNIGTHTLRKTFGYHAYRSGVDIAILQKIFNHSAPSVTMRYIGITQDEIDNVYINMNLG
ncbi:site-specific integrase [Brevibacillus agri]|uniref:site-specific integrase n=1 Tax=Brevibacillus agri TaxID=51101 RepID=UPI0004714B69|nr:site-specific integrase [Brevibacillus agri]